MRFSVERKSTWNKYSKLGRIEKNRWMEIAISLKFQI